MAVFSKLSSIEHGPVLFMGLTLFALAGSRGFSRLAGSLLAGVALGLGVLWKWTFVAYVAGPWLLAIAGAGVDARGEAGRSAKVRVAIHVGVALAVALILAAPWYAIRFDPQAWLRTASNDPTVLDRGYLGRVVLNMSLLGSVVGGWSVAGLTVVLVALSPLRRKAGLWLAATAGPPLAALSFPNTLNPRYLYPLALGWAVAAAMAATGFRSGIARKTAIGLLLLLLALAHGGTLTNRTPGLSARLALDTTLGETRIRHYHGGEALLALVADDARGRGAGSARIAIDPLFRGVAIDPGYLSYLARRGNRQPPVTVRRYESLLYEFFSRDLRNGAFDYLFVDCGAAGRCQDRIDAAAATLARRMRWGFFLPGSNQVVAAPFADLLRSDLAFREASYDLVAERPVGAGSRVLVYRRKSE